MLQAASADTKKAMARGNSQPASACGSFQVPPVPALSNRAELPLRRKCDCGGGPDCDCEVGDRKKKETESPKTALHRKPSGSGAPTAPISWTPILSLSSKLDCNGKSRARLRHQVQARPSQSEPSTTR